MFRHWRKNNSKLIILRIEKGKLNTKKKAQSKKKQPHSPVPLPKDPKSQIEGDIKFKRTGVWRVKNNVPTTKLTQAKYTYVLCFKVYLH